MRVGIAICVLMLLFLASIVLAQEDNERQPIAYIEELVHDFGNIYSQDGYKYAFKMQNRGKADLIIESVNPG